MACRFWSRTRPWRRPAADGRRDKGAVSLAVILMLVVFSALGLAMVHASGLHLRIAGYRKWSTYLDYASENGLKRGLRDFADALAAASPLAPLSEEGLERLRSDPAAELPSILEGLLGAPFPRVLSESLDGMSWDTRAACLLERLEDRGAYVRLAAGLRIEAAGGWARVAPRRESALEASLAMLAGRLPLPAIPFLLLNDPTGERRAALLDEGGLRLLSGPGESLPLSRATAAEGLVPDDPSPLVAKALNVRLFSPQDLTAGRLREALGLEPGDEPVPDGVYLVRNDLGLGGIFVQGDLDEMVLAIVERAQVIVFRAGESEWRLEFSPAGSWTLFRGPDGELRFDLVPLPIVIVNGRIDSLGGGAVAPDGRVEMSPDEELPSVLDGVDLTIVSSDRITITSHLVLEGVRWQEGFPYVRDSKAQLVIYAAGRDVVTGEAHDGGIVVGEAAPPRLKVQGSLTAAGGGFSIEGAGMDIELFGALHADDYNGGGNALSIVRDGRAAEGLFPENAPLTAEPLLLFASLRVVSWLEYD